MNRSLLYFLLGLFISFLNINNLKAQSYACPSINFTAGDTIHFDCVQSACTTISVSLPDIRQTVNTANAYVVASTPFSNAQPFNLPNPNQILVNQDDKYSNVINLPFEFCYYGNKFTQIVVGANGTVSFNTSKANQTSGYEICNMFQQVSSLPKSNDELNFPKNTIFALFHDIDPSIATAAGQTIEWQLLGTAPCRKMVINWKNVAHYGCNTLVSTFQCVLNENTNVIEVFVKEKPICNNWNCGRAVIGIQNNTGTFATTAPNRNATAWTTTNSNSEGWIFVPNGPSLLQNNQLSLYGPNNTLIQTITAPAGNNGVINATFSTQVCVNNTNSPQKFFVQANYTPCSGPNLQVKDSITLTLTNVTAAPIVTSPVNYCINAVAIPLTATGSNLKWYDAVNAVNNLPTAPTPNTNTLGSTTYWVSQTINNCESAKVPVEVIIHPTYNDTLQISICQGSSYTFNNNTYTNSTFVSAYLQTTKGCDSTVHLNLVVKPKAYDTQTITICETQLPYLWNGLMLNSGGNNIANYISQGNNGCDSTTTLNLIVKDTVHINVYDTICQNALPYLWNGLNINTGGIKAASYNTTGANTCDSITHLNLFIKNNVIHPIYDTVCLNAFPYLWRNISITSPGIAVAKDTLTGANGCDSILIYNVFAKDTIQHTVNANVCFDDLPFNWNGHIINTGGNKIAFVTNISTNGCDSITYLNLTIHNNITHNQSLTLCSNQLPIVWNGINVSGGGTNVATYYAQSSMGCDSTVHLNITVQDTIIANVYNFVCENDLPFVWNGQNYYTGGNKIGTYHAIGVNGCDSITYLNLTVDSIEHVTVSSSTCTNQLPFLWNGYSINIGGNAVAVYNTVGVSGCDSIVTLNLTIHDTFKLSVFDTVCSSSLPFVWNGININQGGPTAGVWNGSSSNGCDSVVTLNLTVKDTVLHTVTQYICSKNLPYLWNGLSVNNTGMHVATYAVTTPNGCDSTTRLNLLLIDSITYTQHISICNNQLPYVWNGITVNAGGTNVASYTGNSVFNCDSIVQLNLTVLPNLNASQSISICQNQLPFNWNGIILNSGGMNVAQYTAVGSNGCDSTTTLNLTVNAIVNHTANISICSNQLPYVWNGITVNAGGNNVATFTQTGSNGCDSITTLNLTVSNTSSNSVYDSTCSNQLPFIWNGLTVNTGGNNAATYTTLNAAGCDSITTLHLYLKPTKTDTVQLTICESQLPFNWHNIIVNNGGTAVATVVNMGINNCDSTSILNLNITNTIHTQVYDTICNTSLPYIWNGINITQGGVNIASFNDTAAGGCDSIAHLNLAVKYPDSVVQSIYLCEYDLPYIWNGINVNAGGNHIAQITLPSQYGCDSTTYLDLIVHTYPIHTVDTFICFEDAPFNYNNTQYNTSGTYIVKFPLQKGCDSVVTINLTIGAAPLILPNAVVTGCDSFTHNNTTYYHTIKIVDTIKNNQNCDSVYAPLQIIIHKSDFYTLDTVICYGESVIFEEKMYTTSGRYEHKYINVNGCDSINVLNLKVNKIDPIEIKVLTDITYLCVGDTVLLEAQGADYYKWYIDSILNTSTDKLLSVKIAKTNHDIHVYGYDAYNCSNTGDINIKSEYCCAMDFPNAFSPNNDGLNDKFGGVTGGNPKTYKLAIYDRWGKLVFISHNVSEKWDGTIKGQPCDGGVYFFTVEATCHDGTPYKKKGDVTLIR